jgi:hypothetical protein
MPVERLRDAVVQFACQAPTLLVHRDLGSASRGLEQAPFGQSSCATLRVRMGVARHFAHGCGCYGTQDWIALGNHGRAVHSSGRRAQVIVADEPLAETTAQNQQPSVLASVERVRHARAGPPSEAIWLVVVSCAVAVMGSETASQVLLFLKGHVSRDTPVLDARQGVRVCSENSLPRARRLAHGQAAPVDFTSLRLPSPLRMPALSVHARQALPR